MPSTDLSTVFVDKYARELKGPDEFRKASCPNSISRISFAAPFLALIFSILPEDMGFKWRGVGLGFKRFDSAATD
jgi:hypothetical protein